MCVLISQRLLGSWFQWRHSNSFLPEYPSSVADLDHTSLVPLCTVEVGSVAYNWVRPVLSCDIDICDHWSPFGVYFVSWALNTSRCSVKLDVKLSKHTCFIWLFMFLAAVIHISYLELELWPAPRTESRSFPPAVSASAPQSACTPSESGSSPRAGSHRAAAQTDEEIGPLPTVTLSDFRAERVCTQYLSPQRGISVIVKLTPRWLWDQHLH